MASIIIPGKWTTQPRYPVAINYKNSIARGLQFAWAGGPWAATPSGLFAPSSQPQLLNAVRGEYGGIRGVQCNATPFAFPTEAGSGINGATQSTVFGLVLRTTDQTQVVFNRNTSGDRLFQLSASTFGGIRFYVSSADFSNQRVEFTKTFANNRIYSIAVAWDGPGSYRGYSDGINLGAPSLTGSNVTTYPASTDPSEIGKAYEGSDGGYVYLSLVWNRALSEGEILSLSNNPWQVFLKRPQILYFDVGGGATQDLAGAAAASATATGALTQSIPLAAAGLSVATATGALSISIPLASAASAQANATGGLSLAIPLAASAVAQALAQAGLTHGVPLAGSAAALAAASGALSLSVSLSGSAISLAAASAGLTATGSGLQGDAAATASASGALTHAIPLSGAALTVASAAGGITHIVPLSGSAASASMATGGLDVSVSLNAAALAQALASATLTAQGGMAGDAAALAAASASLTLRVNLDGAAIANAIASGALSADGLIVTGTPGLKITAAARPFRISRAPRAWRIAS